MRLIFDVVTTSSKTLLAVSVAGFVAGSIIDFVGFNRNPSALVALPPGAVFFGMFVIAFMLENEMAGFDKEEAGQFELIRHNEANGSKCNNCKNCECQPVKHL